MKRSVKNKIYLAIFLWVVLSLGMFMFVFGKLRASNQALIEDIMVLKKEEAKLLAEKQSISQAKNDLSRLEDMDIQPKDFFSADITLVNEIRRLENISNDLDLELTLSGISGTLKTATKAKTTSEMYQIPYTISVQGPLPKVVSFIEYLENLEFITSLGMANISSAGNKGINANFTAVFYLKAKK